MPLETRPAVEVLDLVQAITLSLRGAMAAALPAGLTNADFQLLQQLATAEAATPAALARGLRLSRPAVTAILQRLEANGLVSVSADPLDGRCKQLRLTPAGIGAYHVATRALRPQAQALRAALPESEFRAALPFLRALSAALAEISSTGGPAGASRSKPR